jgi:hypothetical protein
VVSFRTGRDTVITIPLGTPHQQQCYLHVSVLQRIATIICYDDDCKKPVHITGGSASRATAVAPGVGFDFQPARERHLGRYGACAPAAAHVHRPGERRQRQRPSSAPAVQVRKREIKVVVVSYSRALCSKYQ